MWEMVLPEVLQLRWPILGWINFQILINAWKNLKSQEWKAPRQHADQATLNMHIFKSRFVLEMRKSNCDFYPPENTTPIVMQTYAKFYCDACCYFIAAACMHITFTVYK